MSKTIGIDLGTTNSCVSVIEGGKTVIIPNERGNRTTPSIVAFTKNGEQLVGEEARRQMVVNSERTVSSIKREMGTDWRMKIDGKYISPQEISAMILRKLRQDAENYLGEKVTDAVITVPAYFNDSQRQATKDAGRIAGLNVKRIINEPTAAAVAYGLDNGMPQKIMVYDLGGGTFDVSIIEIGDGVIEVLSTNGDNHLGGDDFDEKIAEHLLAIIREQHHVDLHKDITAMQRIREAAEQAKKELTAAVTTTISLPYLSNVKGTVINFEYVLTREVFNQLTWGLVEKTSIPVQNALADAGLTVKDLNRVILVGGSTRIPAVQEKVRNLTGMNPSKNINPDECVAQGAAIQGDALTGNATVVYGGGNSLLLLDVTPLSLAIETVGGVATRLVERNTTLPARYSQVFTTVSPLQRNVEIRVLQGERPMAADNKCIGKFRLNGVRSGFNGMPQIEVTFDIDVNGILKVSARDQASGKEQSIIITESDRMSDFEINQAIHDAEVYAATDGIRREVLQSKTEAEKLMTRVEQALSAMKKNISKEEKRAIKNDLAALQKIVSKIRPDRIADCDVRGLNAAIEQLRDSSAGILQASGME